MYDFRRCGQGTDRRRRVLNDDLLCRPEAGDSQSVDESCSPRRGSRKLRSRYAEAARMDAQPRITDLVPRRNSVLALLFFANLLVIAGLETVYAYMPRLTALTTDGRVAAFDLDSEGSLGAWYSSLVLLASGLMSLLIWSLRRHRLDDYHGRYRIWFWAAMTWFLMSVDEACSLHEGFKEMMTHLTGHRLMGDGSIWWIMAYGLLLGTVGLKLLLEIRACRGSTVALALTGLFWVLAVVTQIEGIMPRSGARGVMVEEACEMIGNVFLLLSMTLHARFIIFDVEDDSGESKPKRRRKAAAKPDDAESAASQDDEPAAPAPTRVRKATTRDKDLAIAANSGDKPAGPRASITRPNGQVLRTDPAENPLSGRKLTKAERRAQRRLEKQAETDA